jgi:hypothetical protein
MDYTLGNQPDYVGARAMVNRVDQAYLIAGYASLLEVMLKASLKS